MKQLSKQTIFYRGAAYLFLFAFTLIIGVTKAYTAPDTHAVEIYTSDTGLSIGNRFISRSIIINGRYASTWDVRNRLGNETLPPVREEFAFTLMDGGRVSSKDFAYAGRVIEELDAGGRRLIVNYFNESLDVAAQVVFTLYPDDYVMTKNVRLRGLPERPVRIDALVVEHFYRLPNTEGGGLGQPVFVNGNTFISMAHPAGHALLEAEDLQIMHFPGWTLDGKWRESMTSVMGAAEGDLVRERFFEYVARLAGPPKSRLVYNTWFDLRRGQITEKAALDVYDKIQSHLSNYGVQLDSVVLDDGWHDPDSLWLPDDDEFPKGIEPLGRALAGRGSGLGLWLPLSGHELGITRDKNTNFEAAPDGGYFCIAGPAYNEALRARLEQLVTDARVNYFKHDFNHFECVGQGPGYKPTAAQSIENNVNAQLRILDFLHGLNSDLYLNVTSYLWLSPWWTVYADAVWMGSSDYGENLTAPALEPRDRSITYYDAFLYDLFRKKQEQFPLHSLMTHGIIDGRRKRLGGENEPLLIWSNNVMAYLGRGVLMRELYISPELLSSEQWNVLGRALRWAETRDSVFAAGPGEMRGGDPAKGETYWFSNHDGQTEILTLRNPGYLIGRVMPRLKHPGNIPRVVYPYHEWYDITGVNRYGDVQLSLSEHQVTVIESTPPDAIVRPVIRGLRSRTLRQDETETEFEIVGVPGTRRFFVESPVEVSEVLFNGTPLDRPFDGGYLPVFEGGEQFYENPPFETGCRSATTTEYLHIEIASFIDDKMIDSKAVVLLESVNGQPPSEILLNGKTATATFMGRGWSGFEFPLEYGSHTNRVRITAQNIVDTPFADGRVRVSAFAMGWYPGVLGRVIVRHAPAPRDDSESMLPYPIRQKELRMLRVIHRPYAFDLSYLVPPRKLSKGGLKNVRAAKIRLRVYGSRPGGAPATIMLNGAPVAAFPRNAYPHDIEEEFTIDIPPSMLRSVREKNTIAVTNPDGRPMRFSNITLAVQLEDGTWIRTNTEQRSFCSGMAPRNSRETEFKNKSQPISLDFE